jgi:hypothetical protein
MLILDFWREMRARECFLEFSSFVLFSLAYSVGLVLRDTHMHQYRTIRGEVGSCMRR